MGPKEINFILDTFHFTPKDLARCLGVAPFSAVRWQSGASTPTGLAEEVLRALHETVQFLSAGPTGAADVERAGGFLALGLGSVLFTALTNHVRNHVRMELLRKRGLHT